MVLSFFRRLLGESTSARRKPTRPGEKGRFKVEALEDRLCPAWVVNDLNSTTALALARELVGPSVAISNVTFTGANGAAGKFTESLNTVGFSSGIVLSSGNAQDVAGPNSSGSFSTSHGTPGDPQLNADIAPTAGFDAAVLEFDWVPTGNVVVFSYVFGSDEYAEYAPPNPASYNDVFAFYLNGQNVTFIPGTATPVSIDNINPVTNSQFYIDNDVQPVGPRDTQMDAFTTVLTAVLIVQPGTTNHVKLAIQDAGDSFYDSWVLIKSNSLVAAPISTYAPLRYVYNPITKINSGVYTVTNNSSVDLPGPLYLVFNNVPAGVTILNTSGTTPGGKPYITIAGGLKAKSSYSFKFEVLNPLNKNLGTVFINNFGTSLTNILT